MRQIPACIAFFLAFHQSAPAQLTDDALLDTIQHAAFTYFWTVSNPSNGLISDGTTSYSVSSIASTGFGLSAICIGVDHGWVSRPAARDRVLAALKTFWYGPQGEGDNYIGEFGLFYHMLDMTTARRTGNSELSTIDTGLLLAGIIDARQYFDGTDSLETELRALADSIYYRMQWDFMRNGHSGIMLGYMPGSGFQIYSQWADSGQWVGYSEASIMYILALGSPTHPVDYRAWQTWTSGYVWQSEYGYTYVIFPPLFGHQYSACWIDYRNIADDYMQWVGSTYFENSRSATLAQRAYCRANPRGYAGYSDSLWGITASDGPGGYSARGAPPPQDDNGTITPTAPVSSIAFAPDSVLPVIRNMWNNYRHQLWTLYGFRDAFNLSTNPAWYSQDIIGIDQGPEIIMIENYRTGRVWNRFMKNPDVQRGLAAAHFLPATAVRGTMASTRAVGFALFQNYPNPFNPETNIRYQIANSRMVRLTVYDILGREVAKLVEGVKPPGTYTVGFDGRNQASGVYFYKMQAGSFVQTGKLLLIK